MVCQETINFLAFKLDFGGSTHFQVASVSGWRTVVSSSVCHCVVKEAERLKNEKNKLKIKVFWFLNNIPATVHTCFGL